MSDIIKMDYKLSRARLRIVLKARARNEIERNHRLMYRLAHNIIDQIVAGNITIL